MDQGMINCKSRYDTYRIDVWKLIKETYSNSYLKDSFNKIRGNS